MSTLIFKTTKMVIRLLAKVLDFRFEVHGKENLYDGPTLYVVNHFTRFETLLLPYILYKVTGKPLKTLAKESLFKGILGRYLTSLGVVMSRKDPNRNKAIISNLMTGASNWVIYPEGVMIKNKSTINEYGKIQLKTPYYKGLPRTGAAVMALKAEAIKQLVWKNMREKKLVAARALLKRYGLKVGDLSRKPLRVVPVNITYYPMRFDSKKTKKVFAKLFGKKKLPKKLKEELGVEMALLGNSDVKVTFSKAVQPDELVKASFFGLASTPLIEQQAMIDYVTNKHRFHLTRTFMRQIYHNVFINIDHLLALLLLNVPRNFLTREEIKYYLLSAITYLHSHPQPFNLHGVLIKNLRDLVSIEKGKSDLLVEMNSFLAYAKKNGYIKEEFRPTRISFNKERKGKIKIAAGKTTKQHVYLLQKEKINGGNDFEDIRIENPIRVIYNEFVPMFSLFRPLVNAVKKDKLSPFFMHGEERSYPKMVLRFLEENYRVERERFLAEVDVKSWNVGRPRFYAEAVQAGTEHMPKIFGRKKRCGVVLSHGYKAAPYEVLALGKYLHNQGYGVFIPRLSGHGTYDEAMKSVTRSDWMNDYLLAANSMAKEYEKVFFMGFSAGGLLALKAAAKNKKIKIAGVVTICTPFLLKNIFFKLPSYIAKWNNFCKNIGITKFSYEFLEQTVEHEDTNYRKNYMHGIAELDKLIDETKKLLPQIKVPVLALQGSDDPVVNSESANIIVKGVSSKYKSAVFLERNNHVVVRGFGSQEIFERVEAFVKKNAR